MNNKIKSSRYIDLFLSSYLILAGLLSLTIVIYILISLGLDSIISVIWLIASLLLIAINLVNNYKILRRVVDLKKLYLINLWICLPQSLIFFSDGFHFKYTQGLELVVALNINTSGTEWMLFPINFTHEVIFNFLDSSFTLIGVNLISVVLIIYYIYKIKQIQ